MDEKFREEHILCDESILGSNRKKVTRGEENYMRYIIFTIHYILLGCSNQCYSNS
jgi:hypothetical protein